MRMTVADLMCEPPVTVGPDCTTDEALEAFFEYEAAELYVVDKSGKFLGVLPDYELLKAQLSGEAKGARVRDLMSRSVPVVSLESDAAEVVRRFRDSQCCRMPVVKSGRLIGLVTRNDVLRLMAVLRRIDPQAATATPRAPKHLTSAKSTARAGRNAEANSQSSPGRRRGKVVSRRPAGRSSR